MNGEKSIKPTDIPSTTKNPKSPHQHLQLLPHDYPRRAISHSVIAALEAAIHLVLWRFVVSIVHGTTTLWDIPDEYHYGDPELMDLIRASTEHLINNAL